MLRGVDDIAKLGEAEVAAAIDALEEQTFRKGDVIFQQDSQGDACFFVIMGECHATAQVYTLEKGTRVTHKKHGVGQVVEVTHDPSITKVQFAGESHRYVPASLHKLKPVDDLKPKVVDRGHYRRGDREFFGERALSRVEPRANTVTCLTDVAVLRLPRDTFLRLQAQMERKENRLRSLQFFEKYSVNQIAQLAGVMRPMDVKPGEAIARQGEPARHMVIVESGQCVATAEEDGRAAELGRYEAGKMFGEKALLESTSCAATVTAVGEGAQVWTLSREAFEAKLGPLRKLQEEQDRRDPRRLISNFYNKGDATGPAGALASGAPQSSTSAWFAVYRPCSRDSIAKMLSENGTGKGLNIKGKSAKKNRLSGFVPFCQISKAEDKKRLEETPRDARIHIFFTSVAARSTARVKLERTLVELQVAKGAEPGQFAPTLKIEEQEVKIISKYEPTTYGLDVPEALLMEVYIMGPDLTPVVGWETGRDSEPAFLDMNRHALRDGAAGTTDPMVVLYQSDTSDPMNPLGLLMAYAEARVLPVVSDFDTFLIGSRGVTYDATPPKQVELMQWALTHTAELLATPNNKGWMSRWLSLLKEEAANGFHPTLPKYGFGDPTSYGLIGKIVQATGRCGAVRHGAECFNFYFPQELDPEFLIVWDGLNEPSQADPDKTEQWKSVNEEELRAFLLERAAEGFSFPLNPVWPVRDPGWLEVLRALQKHEDSVANLASWFPPKVMELIEEIHSTYPMGFRVDKKALRPRKSVFTNFGGLGSNAKGPNADSNRASQMDLDGCELSDFATWEVLRERQARWRKIRGAMKMNILGIARQSSSLGVYPPAEQMI